MSRTKRRKTYHLAHFRHPQTFGIQKLEMQAFDELAEIAVVASNRLKVRSNPTSKSNGIPTAWDDMRCASSYEEIKR